MYQTLLQLKNEGTLKQLVQSGLMSAKVFQYLEIYLWIDARIKTSNKSLNSLVTDAEVAFNVSRATVWRSLRVVRGLTGD